MGNEVEKLAALERVLELANEISHDEDGIHPWESEYRLEQLAFACRDWVREIDAGDVKPVGWDNPASHRPLGPAEQRIQRIQHDAGKR